MEEKLSFNYLLQGHISDTLSDEEKLQLLEALNDPENGDKLSAMVSGLYNMEVPEDFVYNEKKVQEMIRIILANTSQTAGASRQEQVESAEPVTSTNPPAPFKGNNDKADKRGRRLLLSASWARYAAVAVVFLGVAFLYHYTHKKNVSHQSAMLAVPAQPRSENDVLPGANKAVLILSNGKKVELNATGHEVITDGQIAIQNNDGSLAYSKSDVVTYNTMATPRGGQYKLKLADGTLVWLNAASSITYPTSFPGKTRMVSITGEAYFEVARNSAKPFTVKTYKDEVTVKGTSFNINSYPDESGIRTSLLEGLVQVNGLLLKPGNAYISGKITSADLDKDLAWKNGVFNFHHVKLTEAMRQIARWYDVEIRYEGASGDIELRGEIGRNLTLQQLLNGLQDKDIRFRLEGKVLTIY